MTATNHALTGAVIAVVLPNPLVSIPLALVSHIAIDALPHFADDAEEISGYRFKSVLIIDIIICTVISGAIFLIHPVHWVLIIACAFVATSPDLLWIPDFIAAHQGKPKPKYGKVRQFLHDVQWSQKRIGIVVEVFWFGALLTLLVAKII